MLIQPYIFFNGRTEEAIEFYKKALGAEVQMMMRFKESPQPPQPGCAPTDPNKIMHAQFRVGESMVLASDGDCKGNAEFKGFALSITTKSAADADKAFKALSDKGIVQMPLMKTFFSDAFGMCQDRFGVNWMIMAGK